MSYVSETWRDHQRHRFMRPDAERYRKPNFDRHFPSNMPLYRNLYACKYRDDQLRHPAGSSEGGGRFAPEGGSNTGNGNAPNVRLAFAGPAASGARAAIQLGLTLYTYMSTRNGSNTQAIVTFKARKFETGEVGIDLTKAETLDRDEVGQVCPKLDEVQRRTDVIAEMVKEGGEKRSHHNSTARLSIQS